MALRLICLARREHSPAAPLWLLASLCRLLTACSDVDDACSNESDCSYYSEGSRDSSECESLNVSECSLASHCSVESTCRPRCSGPSCDDSCEVVSRCIPD
jgi:hypothetical protein